MQKNHLKDRRQLELLFERFLKNHCNPDEVRHLIAFFGSSENEDELKFLILQQLNGHEEKHFQDAFQADIALDEVHQKLIAEIRSDTAKIIPARKLIMYRVAVAATIIISLSVAFYFFKSSHSVNRSITHLVKQDITPGGNKAVLTLSDGSKIILDDAEKGLLTTQSGISISKAADGQLVYNLTSDNLRTGSAIAFNSIETPKGGQYQINLPDGTKVWLNAASSLKFPVKFSGNTRTVELNGEGYFEVAHNKKLPFHVKTNTADVEVLGTHFNVMAYDDENTSLTTLLEGAVKIKSNTNDALLKPGQQATILKASGKMSVIEVDTEEAIAWKNGYFLFNSENCQSIMRKISRWYNVEIIYQKDMSNKDFSGSISRFKNVSEVLKMLELTEAVHFKILPKDTNGKERRIIVMP